MSKKDPDGEDAQFGDNSFFPDMEKIKKRKEDEREKRNSPPIVVSLDRDLQEKYLEQLFGASGENAPIAIEAGTPDCKCGSPLKNTDSFCPGCGKKVKNGGDPDKAYS